MKTEKNAHDYLLVKVVLINTQTNLLVNIILSINLISYSGCMSSKSLLQITPKLNLATLTPPMLNWVGLVSGQVHFTRYSKEEHSCQYKPQIYILLLDLINLIISFTAAGSM